MTAITWRVRDVRGCERADGESNPIALIAGLNRAGKSSIAEAVAAALTGEALPREGLTKGTAGLLVHTGASSGTVEIKSETGSVGISWPQGAPVSVGDPPEASVWAAGLQSVVELSQRERARVLSDYLRASPTIEDLQAVLRDKGWPDDLIATIWKTIEDQGFDKTHAIRKERGAELKGRWRQITGVNYGSRIAAGYRPDIDMRQKEPDLMAAVARAKRDVDNAIAAAAVSSAERDRLAAEADTLTESSATLRKAEAEVAKAAETLRAAQEHRMSLPPVEQPRTATCPHCGEPVTIEQVSLVDVRLVKAPGPSQAEDVKKRRLAIAEAEGKVANATDALHLARRAESDAKAAVERATASRERIANWPKAVETGTDAEAARVVLQRAEKTLTDYRVKKEADDIHEKIETNEILLDELAPEGLRSRKLQKVLSVFIEVQLRALTDAAGWQRVEINPDMAIFLGGRPWVLLSGSERYQVRTVLQVAMACLDGADAVVIDGADILDGPTRSGLFQMITASCLSAIVCMTLSRRERVPDLEQAGLGRSYWLAAGVLEPLEKAKEAA